MELVVEEAAEDIAVPNRGSQRKRSKYLRLLGLPNVHAGLHLADVTREYASVMNCNVLAGELHHRDFKQWADAAAPANLMGYLFAKDVFRQSVRLGLVGAWDYSHPDLLEPLRLLQNRCPNLLKSFLPITEQDPDADAYHDRHAVKGDSSHEKVHVSLSGFSLTGWNSYFGIGEKVKLDRLDPTHEFLIQLGHAYEEEYRVREIVQFGNKKLVWLQRLSYIEPHSRKTWVFKVGDCFWARRLPQLLVQCFIHGYRGQSYLFLITRPLIQYMENGIQALDPILRLPIKRIAQQLLVIGLPAVTHPSAYFIPAPEDHEWGDRDIAGEDKFMMECNWSLSYL